MINDALMIGEIQHSVRSYFEDRDPVIQYLRADMNLGDLVYRNFTGLDSDDLRTILFWRNDDRIRRWMLGERPIEWDDHKRFVETLKSDRRNFYYLVFFRGKPEWVIYLNRFDVMNKCAYWGIYKNPFGTDGGLIHRAESVFLEILFEFLGFKTLKLEVMENNDRAIRFYQKIGFIQEGLLKDSIIRDGMVRKLILMSLLREAFLRGKKNGAI